MSWKEIGTVYVENDGDALYIDGFEADRIRVTAVVATTEDNRGLRVSVGKDGCVPASSIAQCASTTFYPLMFEVAVVGDFAITTPFAPPKSIVQTNAISSLMVSGMQLDSGEQTLKRFRIESSNGELKVGSWVKVEAEI